MENVLSAHILWLINNVKIMIVNILLLTSVSQKWYRNYARAHTHGSWAHRQLWGHKHESVNTQRSPVAAWDFLLYNRFHCNQESVNTQRIPVAAGYDNNFPPHYICYLPSGKTSCPKQSQKWATHLSNWLWRPYIVVRTETVPLV